MTWLVPLPVILPLLGTGLTLILSSRPALQRAVSTTVLSAVVAIAAVLLYRTDRHGPQVVWIGAWSEPSDTWSREAGFRVIMCTVMRYVDLRRA